MIHRLQPILYKLIKWHYRKERWVNKRGIKFLLKPTVFHPSYYLSTDYLLDYIIKKDLNGRKILELGCGSGFISMYLAKHKEVEMYSSDINPSAVSGLRDNIVQLGLKIEIVESDLFDNIPEVDFDYILVNPPYFDKVIESNDEFAFFTGPNFEYFHKFFDQVQSYILKHTIVLIVLSENVKLDAVKKIALSKDLELVPVDAKVIKKEQFLIYSLKQNDE